MDPAENVNPDTEATTEGGSEERRDWKAEAIRAQAERDLLMRQFQEQRGNAGGGAAPGGQSAAPTVSPLQEAEAEVRRLEAELPPLNPSDPNSFWKRQEAKEALDQARQRLADRRAEAHQAEVRAIQMGQAKERAVAQVKAQFGSRPAFKQVEKQFDQAIQQMRPEAAADPNTLALVLKNLLYDAGDAGGQAAPPPAPGSAFAGRPAGKPGAKAQVQFRSEQEAAVAALYGMSAEDYYADRYNQVGEFTEGNGVNVYGLPIGGSR